MKKIAVSFLISFSTLSFSFYATATTAKATVQSAADAVLKTQVLQIKGVAKSYDQSQVLYTEMHDIELDEQGLNKKIVTRYLKPDGKVFAQIVSDFTKNKLVPEVVFEDFRFNKKEILKFEDNNEIVFSHFEVKPDSTKDLKSNKFKLNERMSVGQGFDNFIKVKFDELKDKEVQLEFGVLSELNFYSFKGYAKSKQEGKTIQFGIDLTNPFYRLFSKELLLVYDVQSKRLLSYRGLSNILNDQNKTQNVYIEYEYLTEKSS